jgi:hypothetical protein
MEIDDGLLGAMARLAFNGGAANEGFPFTDFIDAAASSSVTSPGSF